MNFFRRKPAASDTNGSNGVAANSSTDTNGAASHYALVDGGNGKAFEIAGAPPIGAPVRQSASVSEASEGQGPRDQGQGAMAPANGAAPASTMLPNGATAAAATTSNARPSSHGSPSHVSPSQVPASHVSPAAAARTHQNTKPSATESRLSPELAKAAASRIEGNANSQPVIRVRDLKKIYQMGDVEVRALQGVDIDIFPGEITAIMGPSGSGKSTLMNIIGCLDVPSEGSYTLDGNDVSRMNDDQLAEIRCHKIGFVFQSFNLLSRTTALANVELPLIYSGVGGGERHKRARAALELVGLGARLDHKPNELSGGQQQRVAIARALINRPAMILADEPTGNLDSKTSVEIMELFQRLNVEQGITIVFVTHNSETADYCHRTIRVRDGLVEVDRRHRPVAGIYSDPAVLALAGDSVRQYVGASVDGSHSADVPRTDLPRTDLPRTDLPGTDTPSADTLTHQNSDAPKGGAA